jgi:bacterioferritin
MSPQIKPTEQVLNALNETLKAEMTAVHQYLLHARVCANWGYRRLAESSRAEANEEFGHAELLIDRILFLKGTPNLSELFPIQQCPNVKAQLEHDLAFEMEAVNRLNAAIQMAAEAGDNVSRQLFEKILIDENHHVDHLEGELHVIEEIGLANYLAQQIH